MNVYMTNKTFAGLVFIFCFSSGYAQTDSIAPVYKDTLPTENSGVESKLIAKEKAMEIKKEPVYRIHRAVDIPIVAIGTGWSLFAFTKIYNKSEPTDEQLQNLNSSNINSFDRSGIYPYSRSLDINSYYPFYASIPLPIILFLSGKDTRHDFYQLTFLYWEAMSITGLLGTTAPYSVDKYRPFTYNDATSLADKKSHQPKNSFYSGHVGLVATSTFFAAKVYADYHPESKIKWVFYGAASVITAGTGYMRLKGGMHFPSDILLGITVGALSGILVPQFHKIKNPVLSVLPFTNGEVNGLTFTYKFRNKR